MEDIKKQVIKDWVLEYSDRLYAWALSKTSSIETAEDLVQETFLAAVVSFDNFKNKENPGTLLYSILNHKIIDHYRKKSSSTSSLSVLTENQAIASTDGLFNADERWMNRSNKSLWEDETQLLDNNEFIQIMEFCMAELPDKWRIAIGSKYLLERKTDEICQELNYTTTNYWQVIHRAKLLLKKCIEKYWN